MTITVTCTPDPTWAGQGRHAVVVVTGDLQGWEWPKLAGVIAERQDTGADLVVLDLEAVQSCDREALFELVSVRGRWPTSRSCAVDVVGVRASQFLEVMAREPVEQLHDLQVVIAELQRPRVSRSPPTETGAQPEPSPDTGEAPLPKEAAPAANRSPTVSAQGASRGSARKAVPSHARDNVALRRGRHRR